MKVTGLLLICWMPFFESCAQKKQSRDYREKKVGIEKSSARKSTNALYSEQESLKKGVVHTDEGKLITASKLQFGWDRNNELHIQDLNWESQFKADFNHKKVVFWSTEHFQDVRDNELKDVNLEEMRGFDFAPLVVQMKNIPAWDGGEFIQHYIHVPEKEGENRNHWKEENLEYFFMPDNFKFSGNSHIPQFYKLFPDYDLPANKWGATSFIIAADTENMTAKKGYTFTASFIPPYNKRIRYDYDQWLYDLGAPWAYTVSQEAVNDWLEKVDEQALYRSFKEKVIDAYPYEGHLVLNWEALGNPYGPGIGKLVNCMKMWKKAHPNIEISLWPRGVFEMNRVNIEGNNYKYQLTKDLKFQGNFGDWYNQLSKQSPFSINSFLIENADLNYVGGYLNYPTNYGYVHHFVMQHIMNKKYFPEKKSVLMWWHNQEYVGQFELGTAWFKGAEGQDYYTKIKPMVFPSAMHNAAVWAFAFCDGGEMWSEPYGRLEDERYLGANNVFDRQGREVKTQFASSMAGQLAIQNYRNIDRWEGGKWAVSMNKDIIEAKTEWQFVSSSKNGKPFLMGDQILPSYSLYDHTPLVAAKLSENKEEALVLVYDAWNDPLKQEIVKVKIGNKSYDIKVFGRYTSVVRIRL